MALHLTHINAEGTAFIVEETGSGKRAAWMAGRGQVELQPGSLGGAFFESASIGEIDETFENETEMWAWVEQFAGGPVQ